jgi:hypothetical protein
MRGRGGYFIFRLEEIDKEGYPPLDQYKRLVGFRIKRDKDEVKIQSIAEEAFKKIFAGKSFAEIVQEDTTIELHQDSFSSYSHCLGAKGPDFAGALYALKPKETSGVVNTVMGCFIIHCDERTVANNTTADDYRNQQQQTEANRLFSDILKTPEVFDYRNVNLY